MTEKEFRDGMAILQGGCGKNYRETTLPVWWEALKGEYAGAYLSICRELIKTEERLPALSAVMGRLSDLKHSDQGAKREKDEADYLQNCRARAEEAEQIVGNTFENFLRANNGDRTLASLYFGKAYWETKGETGYGQTYDREIARREKAIANPVETKRERLLRQKKEISLRMEIGRAMDAAAGYLEPLPPAREEAVEQPAVAPPSPPEPLSVAESKEPDFDESTLPF